MSPIIYPICERGNANIPPLRLHFRREWKHITTQGEKSFLFTVMSVLILCPATDLDNSDMIYALVCIFSVPSWLWLSFFIHLDLFFLIMLATGVVHFCVVMFSFPRLFSVVSCLLNLLININNDDDNRLGGD